MAHQEIEWLEKHSMLFQAQELAREYSGKKSQWQHPYGIPKPKEVIETAENWFTAYPLSMITEGNESVLEFLGRKDLWDAFQTIGLKAVHTGPMKVAGGIENGKRTPSVDGGFDRISYHIDPEFGTVEEYLSMVTMAKKHSSIIIGDLVPGHTGLGPDFLLALKNYRDYPGIYHMIEIDERDWHLLPNVPQKDLSKNLTLTQVEQLRKKDYISGALERVLFSEPGVKETNWSATHPIRGVDGIVRRWVYLHYFKAGQPTLDWLDPSFAANRILSGDIIVSLHLLHNRGVRLDANGFLGIEKVIDSKKAWSEGHPLSVGASDSIAQMTRKLGGFSFQELNLGLLTVKAFLENGADLTYDFLTRAGYLNALIHQNTDLLRLSYELLSLYCMQPYSFIHAMQNHDEFNYELNHINDLVETYFSYQSMDYTGFDLVRKIQKEDYSLLTEKVDYNLPNKTGPCGTMIGLIAGALHIPDVFQMSEEDKERIKKAHLLLVFFNAMQPGVFAISGWDLVGSLPLQKSQIDEMIKKDGDGRWIQRGSYELLGCSKKTKSIGGMPKAKALYGPLPKQLKDPNSFANGVKNILKIRTTSNIATAELVQMIPAKHRELLLLLHRLPGTKYLELTAINFSDSAISEEILIQGSANTSAINLMERKAENKDFVSDYFTLEMKPMEGKAILFQPGSFPSRQK